MGPAASAAGPSWSNMIRERLEQELASNKQLRQYIRRLANSVGKSYRIVLVDGGMSPCRMGRSGYNVPTRGKPVVAWPSTYYGRSYYWAHSTRRIEVGSDWLFEELMTRNYTKVKHGEEKENRTA
jgi:hypothetical protein